MKKRYVLTFTCHDVPGIVASVSTALAEHNGFVVESAQFGDASTGMFFMRCVFEAVDTSLDFSEPAVRQFLTPVAERYAMQWQLHDLDVKPKVLLLVSKQLHCLNNMLYRYQCGNLPIDVVAVVSNHEVARSMVEWHGVPFYYYPVSNDTRATQEQQIIDLVEKEHIDLVVLARYMQILSPDLTNALTGKAINIHHSFLPSFKGAKPYHQAYDRGVKIIGATAHYVTDALDEGPIIEQEVVRVNHTHTPEELVALGGDIESRVLAHAVRYHIEHRVLLNGNKTVVFS